MQAPIATPERLPYVSELLVPTKLVEEPGAFRETRARRNYDEWAKRTHSDRAAVFPTSIFGKLAQRSAMQKWRAPRALRRRFARVKRNKTEAKAKFRRTKSIPNALPIVCQSKSLPVCFHELNRPSVPL